MNVTKFHMDNINDSHDIKNLRSDIQSINGVKAIRVDDIANTITVEYEDGLSTDKITDAINRHKNVRH